jgi:hypothetical protein
MRAMKKLGFLLALFVVAGVGCDNIFGSKNDETNEEIFDEGKIDPRLENVDGYAPVLPFWESLMHQMMYILVLILLYMLPTMKVFICLIERIFHPEGPYSCKGLMQ